MRTKRNSILAWVLSLVIAVTFMPIFGEASYGAASNGDKAAEGQAASITIEAVGDEEAMRTEGLSDIHIQSIAEQSGVDASMVADAAKDAGFRCYNEAEELKSKGILMDEAAETPDAKTIINIKDLDPVPVLDSSALTSDMKAQEYTGGGKINISYNELTGMATVTGQVSGDEFYYLYVDDDSVEYIGDSSFRVTIDMKDYEVGIHEIYADLYDSDEIIYGDTLVVTGIYDAPSIALNDFNVTYSCFTYTPDDSYYYDSDCPIYIDVKEAGGEWEEGFGPIEPYEGYRIRGLKKATKYTVRAYYAKEIYFNGQSYIISGKNIGLVSKEKVFKSGSFKPVVKSMYTTKVRQWTRKVRINYFDSWGNYMYSRIVKYRYTAFRINVRMKKKPQAKGIYIGSIKKKGNKKYYHAHFTLSGKKKGKKLKFSLQSYQSKVYGGWSQVRRKKVRIH